MESENLNNPNANQEILDFLHNIKTNLNNFKQMRYLFSEHNNEVAEIAKMLHNMDTNGLKLFWQNKAQQEYFELEHPFIKGVVGRAVKNYFDDKVTNYIFMIDKDNKHPWIILQNCFLINYIVVPNEIYKLTSWWEFQMGEEIFNYDDCLYADRKYGILLDCYAPQHYFKQNFNGLVEIYDFIKHKKSHATKSFLIPESMKKNSNNDIENMVFIYPNLNADYSNLPKVWDFMIRESNIKENSINEDFDLTLWIGLPSTHYRKWIEMYHGISMIIIKLLEHFNNIFIYYDGLTNYEFTQFKTNLDDEHLNLFIKELQENLANCSISDNNKDTKYITLDNKKITILYLGQKDYRTKISSCKNVDFIISEGNTTAIIPTEIYEKPGVVFIPPHITWARMPINQTIANQEYMCLEYDDLQSGIGDYHFVWEHLYNLSAEVLENLSQKNKLKIQNLKMDRLIPRNVKMIAAQYEIKNKYNKEIPIEFLYLYGKLESSITKQINELKNAIKELESKQAMKEANKKKTRIEKLKNSFIKRKNKLLKLLKINQQD